jgi:hypothetical protein
LEQWNSDRPSQPLCWFKLREYLPIVDCFLSNRLLWGLERRRPNRGCPVQLSPDGVALVDKFFAQ